MKKVIISALDFVIFILCFLFLLSSFFKIVSYTIIEQYIYTNSYVLIFIWILGIFIAALLTHPLFRWILHFRSLDEQE